MSKRKKVGLLLLIVVAICLNVTIIKMPNDYRQVKIQISFDIMCDEQGTVQLFYGENYQFSEANSIRFAYDDKNEYQHFVGEIEYPNCWFRWDFPETCESVEIKNVEFANGNHSDLLNANLFENVDSNDISQVYYENDIVYISVDGEDGWVAPGNAVVLEQLITEKDMQNALIIKVICCVVIDLILLLGFVFSRKVSSLPKELYQNRKLIFKLAKNDFKTRYAGSYLGIFWAFVQPIVTIAVYWFVFEKGLKVGNIVDKSGLPVPFVLWLTAGLIPWFFFSEALPNATNALVEYSYLVKKVVFKISILPVIKVISAVFVHAFFVLFTIILFLLMGYGFDGYTLQVVYYSLCMFMFVLALAYTTCAVVIFFRDLTQIINIVLQIGMWMTPIMWQLDVIKSEILQKIFMLNPMYYVVSGYRDALIYKQWFWEQPQLTLYFWGVTIVIFGIGALIFKRLKPHFADVL